ncbi:MAG: glycoside hydrolase family 108 protein [Bacillota bacterium]
MASSSERNVSESEKFRRAIEILLAHEGGLSEDPHDPGGITHWGISLRSYPHLGVDGIRNLTRGQAIAIYRRDWWDRLRLGEIESPEVSAKVFDLAVNVGAGTGIRLLQKALVATGHPLQVDGIIGPVTLKAANEADPDALLAALREEAAHHYRLLIAKNPELARYEKGWLNRAYA